MMAEPIILDVRFEHYRPSFTLGVTETRPRISWRYENVDAEFEQEEYEIELSQIQGSKTTILSSTAICSAESHLVPWPSETPMVSRDIYSVRVRARQVGKSSFLRWSEPSVIEAGLLQRTDWTCQMISAPWSEDEPDKSHPEDLFRKEFSIHDGREIISARLYVTAHGLYEAEINGTRVGDYFLAPGWTQYHNQLQYQTYDVAHLLPTGQDKHCLGLRLVEGWYKGRIGFDGGKRNIWGTRTAVFAQLEIQYGDGSTEHIGTDASWSVSRGPIRQAEIYDGEFYDSTAEIQGWSVPRTRLQWEDAVAIPGPPNTVQLTAGLKEPARRINTLRPRSKIITPSKKILLDFGQNLVGYVRIKGVNGPRGHRIILNHAEVLEGGELGTRPLRLCKAQDVFVLGGDGERSECYEPRFTFHGFRYVQIDGWLEEGTLIDNVEAVVCHTDMEEIGTFGCSDSRLERLYSNTKWSMKGNFLSIPTDCPQRDERLGWTGDVALFAPAATSFYQCSGILRDWLKDLAFEQKIQGGIPPMVCPNVIQDHFFWGHPMPAAIWHDAVILVPWALWQETGDCTILEEHFASMESWIASIPRSKSGQGHLWNPKNFQLGVSCLNSAS